MNMRNFYIGKFNQIEKLNIKNQSLKEIINQVKNRQSNEIKGLMK